MRKLLVSMMIAGLLAGGTAFAAPASANTLPKNQTVEETIEKESKGVVHYTQKGSFLTKPMTLSGSVSYKPFEDDIKIAGQRKDPKHPLLPGILYAKEGNITAAALVLNGTLQTPNPVPAGEEDLLGDLFAGNQEGKDNVKLFNEFVPAFSTMINEEIREGILQKNKKDHLNIPENILHLDLNDFEKLQPWGKQGYTTGGRFLFEADGWLVPAYVKVYVFKTGNSYRYLTAVTSDASRDIMNPALDLLARQSETMK